MNTHPTSLLYPHGFGDVIQALPAFRAYAAKVGEQLRIGVLKRLPACRQVLEHQPFVAEVFGLPDPWNDFEPANTREAFDAGRAAIEKAHPEGWFVPTARPLVVTDLRMAKVFRVADELGVRLGPEDLVPSIAPGLDPAAVETGRKWARAQKVRTGRLIAIHGQSGNPAKDVAPDRLLRLARERLKAETSDRIMLPCISPQYENSVAFHWGALDECDLFIGVDSGPAHLASTTRAKVIWVFTVTPIEQALPLGRQAHAIALGNGARGLVASWDRWHGANMLAVDLSRTHVEELP